MATSITAKFLNQDKRETEALTVTLPAVLDEGGGRNQSAPTYMQGGEDYIASVGPKESIIGKSYLVVEEAFPAGALVTVSLGATVLFTGVAVSATGITISTVEDVLFLTGSDMTITVSGVTGDITTGKLAVITNYVPYTVKNGRYSDVPLV